MTWDFEKSPIWLSREIACCAVASVAYESTRFLMLPSLLLPLALPCIFHEDNYTFPKGRRLRATLFLEEINVSTV